MPKVFVVEEPSLALMVLGQCLEKNK